MRFKMDLMPPTTKKTEKNQHYKGNRDISTLILAILCVNALIICKGVRNDLKFNKRRDVIELNTKYEIKTNYIDSIGKLKLDYMTKKLDSLASITNNYNRAIDSIKNAQTFQLKYIEKKHDFQLDSIRKYDGGD
jgi:hypothetical protein